jgi:7-carboxy-7-deazaguanine synthase
MAVWRGAERVAGEALLVSEIFGPTIQGEGPSAGQTCTFVRLGGCNLSCDWCDTPYTWDAARYDLQRELVPRQTAQVAEEAIATETRLVVITGGEPLLQSRELATLVARLQAKGRRVEFETNGTLSPAGLPADLFVVSPKLRNSGLRTRSRLRWSVLAEFAALRQACFKFVVHEPSDLDEVETIAARLHIEPERTWVMPEAADAAVLIHKLKWLADAAATRGWSVSSRLQLLAWDGRRGH